MTDPLTILLVDESKFFLAIERQFLRKTPAGVLEAENGEDALKVCRDLRPTMVFLAFKLPGIQGPEVCRRIKTDPDLQNISIIMICETNQAWQVDESRRSGCDGVLAKPLDRHKFLEIGSQFVSTIRSPRHACLIPVVIRSNRGEFRGKCLDISTGGLFLQCSEDLHEGEQFEIELSMPVQPAEVITCRGVIAWLNDKDNPFKPHFPVGFGTRFLSISEHGKTLIRNFVGGGFKPRQS